MSDDLGLQDRLVSLATAVPVRPSSPASALVRGPVQLGSTLRPARGRSWAPLALVALLLVAAVGILGSGDRPAYGPVVEAVRQGEFELTLRSEKGRFGPGEPIEITATLTYRGPDEGVDIRHAQGAGGGPIGFGIREAVVGDLQLSPAWRDSCELTRLVPATPLEQRFEKSAGWSGSDPRAAEYRAWIEDPELRLEAGTWHVFAVAEFSPDECRAPEYQLEAEIVITVESVTPSAASTTEPPSPTVFANPEQSVTVRDGDFELTIGSDRTRYAPGEAIGLTTSLAYVGSEDSIDISHQVGALPLVVGIREPVYGVELEPLARLSCGGTTLQRGVPLSLDGLAGGFRVPDGPGAEPFRAFIFDPILRLPVGTWHVYAWAQTSCLGAGPTTSLQAEIEITVGDADASTPEPSSPQASPEPSPTAAPPDGILIPLWTATEAQQGCYLQFHSGVLARHPDSGLGIIELGTLKRVQWPFGYRALDLDGIAVLLGPEGQELAREGDVVAMSGPGGPWENDVIYACPGAGRVGPVAPS